MGWIQYTVLTTTAGSDLVSELLMNAGSTGTMIEDKNDVFANQRPEGQWDIIDEAIAERIGDDVRVTGYFEADETLRDRVTMIESGLPVLRERTPEIDFGKLTGEAKGLEDEDWAESWKKCYKPFRLGEHIVIKPTWEKFDPEPEDHIIEIDPGLAFGTGTHETTGMCVALIEKYVKPGMSAIDIGTGSGILAIAAAHMGAKPILATDLDAIAVRVAAENVAANGFDGIIETRCGDLLDAVSVTGDIVIANIIADVIVMLAAPVRAHINEGGMFICSGIAIDRLDEVLSALNAAHYRVEDLCTKGEWAAIASFKD